MKKLLLALPLLLGALDANSQTQIENSNFEAWETTTPEIAEPINWNSYKTATGSFNFDGSQQLNRSTDVRPGSTGLYSARIWTAHGIGSGLVIGNLTLGRIEMGAAVQTSSANYNYTVPSNTAYSETFTDQPDSVVVWVKYLPTNIGAGNEARITTVIHENTSYYHDPVSFSSPQTVATAFANIPYTGGNWQRISIPFSYVGNTANAAFILTTFRTNTQLGYGDLNDTLYVDDMELIYNPKANFTASATTICQGHGVTFTSSTNNHAVSYLWDFGDGSATGTTANPVHNYATTGTYYVTLTTTNQWGSATSSPLTVTVNGVDDATFSYNVASFCADAGNQTPTVADAGVFSSTSGLMINSSTGVINLATSTPGSYTVTNTTSGICPDVQTTNITINAVSDASFSYPATGVCITAANQTPTVATEGTFAAASGLVFVNAVTGEINIGASTPGPYVITHTVSGTCPSSYQFSLTIASEPNASFSYTNSSFCTNEIDPSPVLAPGAIAGTFSSTAGLNIEPYSGVIDLSESTPGTYTVTNAIGFIGICPATSETFNITISATPYVSLTGFNTVCSNHSPFQLTGGTPVGGTYSGNGVTAGIFDPATVTPGTIGILYAYTDPTTNCYLSTTNVIVVDACLGLENNEVNTLEIYPNPTNGNITVDNLTEDTTFEVVSATGQIILGGTISNALNTIDLSSFEAGIYLIQVYQKDQVNSIRVIKN